MPLLGELASALNVELRGDPARQIDALGTLSSATENQLTFVSDKRHRAKLSECGAGAVILHPDWLEDWPGCALLTPTPYVMYARATRLFDNHPLPSGRIDDRAHVASTVAMGANVTIDALAVVEEDVVLGDRVWIGAGAFIGRGTRIGSGTTVKARAVICHDVTIGERCTIHPNATIGADGFGFAPSANGWEKIEQLGSVLIGDDVEIGANSCVDRGALENTVIEQGVIIDNLVQIGHAVFVGQRTAIASQVGIAGSTKIGARCTLAGQAGISGHLEIADDVHIGGKGGVLGSIKEPGHYTGIPVRPTKEWLRSVSRVAQLDQVMKRLAELEQTVEALQAREDS